MAKDLKLFNQYLKEQAEASPDLDRPLKGYKAEQLIGRIGDLMEILSDDIRFGVPSDTLGRATTYRDANGAIQKIKDMQHYYDSKNEEVRFYCWSISYRGSWNATKNLKKKIEEAGGFGEEGLNMNLKKIIEYFTQNPEDSDNVASISISMDAMSIRKAMSKQAEPTAKETETAKTPVESTEKSQSETSAE
jgi:hypothetical protein